MSDGNSPLLTHSVYCDQDIQKLEARAKAAEKRVAELEEELAQSIWDRDTALRRAEIAEEDRNRWRPMSARTQKAEKRVRVAREVTW